MHNKNFDMIMNSIKGSLAIEGLKLDESFVEAYRNYCKGELTWQELKVSYPYIGEERGGVHENKR